MRVCANCRREDRRQMDRDLQCNCNAERYEPEVHDANCKALIHDVVLYLVRIPKSDLTPKGELSSYYHNRDWRLKRDGNRFYRGKFLCHACIDAEEQALERKAEYNKLCREAAGISDQTYAQMLAQALN